MMGTQAVPAQLFYDFGIEESCASTGGLSQPGAVNSCLLDPARRRFHTASLS